MKGMVDTKDVLKPLVKKKTVSIRAERCAYSHIPVPQMNKLLAVSDGGMIPYPTLEQETGHHIELCGSSA